MKELEEREELEERKEQQHDVKSRAQVCLQAVAEKHAATTRHKAARPTTTGQTPNTTTNNCTTKTWRWTSLAHTHHEPTSAP